MIPSAVSCFNWFDVVVIVLTLVFTFFGYIRGLVKEVLSIISWASSFALTALFYEYVGDLFYEYIKQPVIRKGIGVVVSFVFIIMFFLVATSMISEKVSNTKFSSANKSLGAIIGILKSFILFVCLYLTLIIFDSKKNHFKFMHAAKFSEIFTEISISLCEFIEENKNSGIIKKYYDLLDKKLLIKERRNSEKESEELCKPKISEVVYEKKSLKPEAEREEIRKKYVRKANVFGSQNSLIKKDVKIKKLSNKRRLLQEHKNLIENLDKGLEAIGE